ncbi:MAG TPA: hypothetical protein V6D33_12475 [Cyanophyceae cyanobacterium]
MGYSWKDVFLGENDPICAQDDLLVYLLDIFSDDQKGKLIEEISALMNQGFPPSQVTLVNDKMQETFVHENSCLI